MDPLSWLVFMLRNVAGIFPIEVAPTLGVLFFALSWVVPRRIVTLPQSARRAKFLTRFGTIGALAILAVATFSSWLGYLYSFPDRSGFDGWLRRPAPLFAATAVVVVGACLLSREPRPAPGERGLAPRRPWWSFAPRVPIWTAAVIAAILVATTAWHALIGVSAAADANRFGNVPDQTQLPVYFEVLGGSAYVAGAGWPNHLATLLAVGTAAAALIAALAADANRPLGRLSAAGTSDERTATARTMVFLILGGLLLTLGAVWAHIGFAGDRSIGLDLIIEPADPDSAPIFVGSDYQAFAPLIHKGGYVIQGLGAALLLRLAVDSIRAARAARRDPTNSGATASPNSPDLMAESSTP